MDHFTFYIHKEKKSGTINSTKPTAHNYTLSGVSVSVLTGLRKTMRPALEEGNGLIWFGPDGERAVPNLLHFVHCNVQRLGNAMCGFSCKPPLSRARNLNHGVGVPTDAIN